MAQLTKSGENSYLWSLKFYWLFYEPFLACLPKHGNRTLLGEHENSRLSQVNDHNSSQQFWFSHSDCLLNLTSKLWAQLNIWIIGISKFVKLFFWVPAWKTNIWEQWRLLYCGQGELPSFPPVSRLRFSSQARGCQIPRRWADPDIFTNARTLQKDPVTAMWEKQMHPMATAIALSAGKVTHDCYPPDTKWTMLARASLQCIIKTNTS